MDYEKYVMSKTEWGKSILLYVLGCGIVGFFFYRSWVVSLLILPGYPLFLNFFKKELVKKRKKRLIDEFSETLISVSINLKSGYSLENSFVEAYKDITMFYGEQSLMAEEIMRIRKGLEINITLEDLVEDLAERSHEEEIRMFGDVIKSAKRNGGNITEVLSYTADRIREGICVDKEIEVLISEKRLELRIMEAVPFFILIYLELTSVGYFDVLYEGIRGRLFMTVCLAVYVCAVLLGHRITEISV